MEYLKIPVFLVLIGCIGCINNALSQSGEGSDLTYVSPVPGSKYIMPGNNIVLRHGEPFDPESINQHLLIVSDQDGDILPGRITLSSDLKTLIYNPLEPYHMGDEIHVKLSPGLRTINGTEMNSLEFKFSITQRIIQMDQEFVDRYIREQESLLFKPKPQIPASVTKFGNDSLPEGYASGEVLVDGNPPDGYYFFTPCNEWNWNPGTEPFLTITDKYGTPVYYKKLLSNGYDLKKRSNGKLSYYTFQPYWKHQVMDSSYRIIGSYGMGNGYTYTDFHDFQLLENGHSFVGTYDSQLIDMSLIVPGGNPEAIVTGYVMQEIDADNNVILQWRSWDHFEITETGPEIDLTADVIDYVHGNTIEVESDTSILISSRNFHEVTKIHRNTGEIIWRLGGSQNQFEFVGDTLQINRQHDSRRLSNGHISVYDNGSTRPEPQFSSVPEFEINTDNMTATLVNRYRHIPDYFGYAMGNAYWTPDSTIVIGWGTCVPGFSEIDYEGNVLYELQFAGISYRAYRFPWKSNYFTTSTDTLIFEYYQNDDTVTKTINIFNQQNYDIEITGFHTQSESFYVDNNFPLTVPPGSSVALNIKFITNSNGFAEDLLTINSDINSDTLIQRASQQIWLEANQISGQSEAHPSLLKFYVYPNPVKSTLVIENLEISGNFHVQIYNSEGNRIIERPIQKGKNILNLQNFPTGIYMVVLMSDQGDRTNYKIIKP